MSRKIRAILSTTALLLCGLVAAGPAHAVAVEFNSAIANLDLIGKQDNGDGTITYRVTFSFDFSSWDTNCDNSLDSCGSKRATHLRAINFAFGQSENPDAVLVSTNAPGSWNLFDTAANGNGCGAGGSNQICAEAADPSLLGILNGEYYEWTFDITVTEDFDLNIFNASMRANFVQCDSSGVCKNAGLMSLRTVPEPATLTMFGLALLLLGFRARRRTPV